MKESALTSSNRLGGAVISDRIVASLLEELRTGRYARADRLPAEVDLAAELGVSRTVLRYSSSSCIAFRPAADILISCAMLRISPCLYLCCAAAKPHKNAILTTLL